MLSRGKLLVQMALEKKSLNVDVNSPRINITPQGSTVVSGPVWSDRGDRSPDITCYESDISDTEITPSTNPVIKAHLQTQTENEFLRESDTEVDPVPVPVPALNDEVSLQSSPSDTTDKVNILPKPSGSIANQTYTNVDHTYPFYTEETRGNDNEICEEDEVQSEELDDSGADDDYRPGSHDDDDPSDGDISSEDSDSRSAGDTNKVGSLYTVTAEEPNPLYVDHEEEVETTSSKRKNKKRKHNWTKNQNKRLRMMGKKYKGQKKVNDKYEFCVERAERILTPSKCSKRCEKSKVIHCSQMTEEYRQDIFSKFWEHLDWDQRKVYVNSLVLKEVPKRRKEAASRRNYSFKYTLWKNNERIAVCKNMFLSTLGIGEQTVYAWLKDASVGFPKPSPGNKRRESREKRDAAKVSSVNEFLDKVPKMESHYCRSSSSKLYIQQMFLTRSDLFKEYQAYCLQNHLQAGRWDLFSRVFSEKNLSIFSPRKDQCDLCCAHKEGNISDSEYLDHIAEKNAAQLEKDKDKERCQADKTVKVVTLDLECVMLCPKLQASALYYKTKLASHNFTVFELNTKDVTCYFWHEGEGNLSINSFASCVNHYIDSALATDSNIKEFVLFSDGCTYQNRNVVLSNALLKLSVEKQIRIIQKYLEKGHTYMEVDSVHSVIERKVKNKPIYVPQHYIDAIKEVRQDNPYEIHYVDHTFFKNYSELNFYTSIRPGTRVGDPVVTNLRVLQYSPKGEIMYKLNFGDQHFSELPRRAKYISAESPELKSLHNGPLRITRNKFGHLQELKVVMSRDYHPFYDALVYE